MKNIKKFMAVFLSVLIMLSVLPITAFAAEASVITPGNVNISGENEMCKWSYTANDRTLYVDGENITGTPDTINFAYVDMLPIYITSEDGSLNYYKLNPEHVIFSKNVKSINNIIWVNASGNRLYPNLKTVEIEKSETVNNCIGILAFQELYCKEFIIPDSVTDLAQKSFLCASIENLYLNKVETIGRNAFDTAALGNMTITESVLQIQDYAFYGSAIGGLTWEDADHGVGLLDGVFSNVYFGTFNPETQSFDEEYDLVIPSRITSIPDFCFEGAQMKSISFEEKETADGKQGLKSIGCCAFEDAQIPIGKFPSTLEKIGYNAFYNNDIITEIDLSNTKVTRIEGSTFYSNGNLESVKLNENTTYIGNKAFYKNPKLASINLPEKLTYIGSSAFYQNSLLTNVVLPESLVEIGDNAFYSDTKITGDLYLPNLKIVGNGAFYKTAITSFVMNTESEDTEEAPLSVGVRAFRQCKSLKTVVLPKHLGAIYEATFENSAIDSITIPEDVTVIERYAFNNCTNLAAVDFTLNSKLTTIGAYAFRSNTVLVSVELPSSLSVIEDYAFNGCSALESVGTLTKNLQSIGTQVFTGTSLKSITIQSVIAEVNPTFISDEPEGFVVYGYENSYVAAMCDEYGYAFMPIQGSIELPDDPDFISKTGSWENGSWYVSGNKLTIAGTGNLTKEFIAPDGKTVYTPLEVISKYDVTSIIILGDIKSIPDGFIYDAENVYPNIDITSVSLPDSVMKIGAYAFYGANLTTFKAPRDLISVGEHAFEKNIISEYDFTNCKDLSIGAFAFANPSSKIAVKPLTMDSTVTRIGNSAFVGNTINQVYLTGVTTIGPSAFQGVPVSTLTIDGAKFIGDYAFDSTTVTSLTIPSSVNEIGKYAFANNIKLVTLKFEDDCKLYTIPEGAFYSTGISSVSLPATIERLEKLSFANCKYLKKFSLPKSITYIYYDADSLKDCAFATMDDGTVIESVVVDVDPTNKVSVDYINNLRLTMTVSSKYADAKGENITGGGAWIKKATWIYYEANKTIYVYSEDSIAGLGFKYDNGTQVKHGDIQVDKIEILSGTKAIGGLTTESMFAVFNPKYVVIPNTVTRISENAFTNCTRLEGIAIPDSVTELSAHVFDNCESLKSVRFGTGIEKVSDSLFKNIKTLQFVDLGGVKEVGINSFKNCTNLEEIIIPDTVETVNSYAFYKCLNVKHISIGSNLANIGNYSFAYMPLCDRIEINSNTFNEGRFIGTDVFKETGSSTTGINVIYGSQISTANLSYLDNVKVSKLTFSEHVDGIRNLKNLPYLKEINVDENNPNLFAYKNCLYTNNNELIYVPSTLTRVDIMPATEKICENAFKDSKVLNITLPNGLKEIANYAFYGCKELKRVSFPEKSTLKTIGDSAFENCSALKSVLISKPVQVIGKKAFKNCKNLTSIVLPDSLKTISQDAFVFCNSLTYVVVPEGTETIDTGAFAYCDNLEEIYIFYNTQVNYNAFNKSPKVNIHTIAASPAYVFARGNKIAYTAYTDEDTFFDIAMMKLDIIAGYLGYCANGHGNTEYLTVYEADCEHDGYVIGVCEDCSEILEEIHTESTGHNYSLTVDIAPTQSTKGMKVYTCSNCNQSYCETIPPLGGELDVTTQKVSGTVVIAMDKKATKGNCGIKGASIIIDGYTVATTDEQGKFSFDLETGTYVATVHYNYGFDRQIYIVVDDKDVNYGSIPIIGCDWNKDGKIDDEDLKLFSMVASTQTDDLSYLEFVDMDGDGLINGIDLAYIRLFLGYSISSFEYENIIMK